MTEQIKIKLTDGRHLMQVGQALEAYSIVEKLEAAAEGPLGKLPGMAAAIALVQAEAAHARGSIVAKNLIAATKHGVDIATSLMFIDGGGYLLVEPMDLGEGRSE